MPTAFRRWGWTAAAWGVVACAVAPAAAETIAADVAPGEAIGEDETEAAVAETSAVPNAPADAAAAEAIGEDGTAADAVVAAADDDGFEWGALPYVAGNTDIGVQIGLAAILAQYREGYAPHQWWAELAAYVSLLEEEDGLDVAQQFYSALVDLPNLGPIRFVPQVLFRRITNTGWYGVGNRTHVGPYPEGGPLPPRFNQYLQMEPIVRLNAKIDLPGPVDLLVGPHFRYVMPRPYEGSLLARQIERQGQPGIPELLGTGDHPIMSLAVGAVWDTRNSEVWPTGGFLHEVSLRGSAAVPDDGAFWYGGATADARFYLAILDDYLVLATRVAADLLFGDVPFHELGTGTAFTPTSLPGGSNGVRGVPAGRYAGRIKLLGSTEFRSMFLDFTIFGKPVRLGAAVFFDAGRVWTDYEPRPDTDGLRAGIHYGVGGGIHLQWGTAATFRFEVAWSPDAGAGGLDLPVGIYAGFGRAY